DVGQYRWPSLRGWYFQSMMHAGTSIMERMAMFWFNHFGMADVGEHRAQYQYIQLFREEGIGNYRTMIEKITVHPAMLVFLNGHSNNKWQPNENYARELLELFTIQKGPQVSTGDYTHYTEQDVQVAAKILTGWQHRGHWSYDPIPVSSTFLPSHHWNSDPNDPTNYPPKTLSHRFDNVTIANNGADEYKDLIAVIFGKRETARAFCRELYRFFVYYKINDQVETDVIEPLADVLIGNDFEIKPTLEALFGSQHFYDMGVRGPLIKSPYDFMFSILRPMGGYSHMDLELTHTRNESNLYNKYELGSSLHWWATTMDMDFLYPPSVAGWKAYYQFPTFYRNWIGSTTLQRRRELVRRLVEWGFYSRESDEEYRVRHFDLFAFVASLDAPTDPNELVAECAEIFLPRTLHPDQLAGLKANLLDDLPDDEWSRQYADYLRSPNNPMVSGPIEARLKSFFSALFSMAEFHLM
ncbi:MAG: DUF1800 family protein, partial [Bacteroidota bacterium]